MGLRKKPSGGTTTVYVTAPNPDPYRFTIRQCVQVGRYLVAEVHYPDCTTFGGNKVMVYEDVTEAMLRSRRDIDPHFLEEPFSPVARFPATPDGLRNAMRFAHMMVRSLP